MKKKNIIKLACSVCALLLFSCSPSSDTAGDIFGGGQTGNSGSSGNSGSASNGYAPSYVVNKEFRFYFEGESSWTFKALPGTSSSNGMIVINTSYAYVTSPNIVYKKTGVNTATFDCYYIANFSNGYGSWNQYKFTLTFTSTTSGRFTGKLLASPTDEVGKNVSGTFMYNSDKEPPKNTNNGDSKDENDSESPGSKEDLAKIVGKWEQVDAKNTMQTRFYYFEDDGSYTHNLLWLYVHSGTFKCSGNSITLYVDKSASSDVKAGEKINLKISNGKLIDGNGTYVRKN